MRAEYVECQNCGQLIWSPILGRHLRQQECKNRALMKAVEAWYGARKLGWDDALKAATDEVLFQKAKERFY